MTMKKKRFLSILLSLTLMVGLVSGLSTIASAGEQLYCGEAFDVDCNREVLKGDHIKVSADDTSENGFFLGYNSTITVETLNGGALKEVHFRYKGYGNIKTVVVEYGTISVKGDMVIVTVSEDNITSLTLSCPNQMFTVPFVGGRFSCNGKTNAKAHEWSWVSYTWSDDCSECTAKRTCKNKGCNAVETETVGTTWKYNDTYEKKIYTTNEFQNPAFSKQAKEAGSEILGPGDEPTEPVTPPTQKKAANPLKIRGKIAIVKYSNLKTKAQALRISDVVTTLKKGKGTLTYAKIFGNKNIIISKKTGKVILKKGLKKGTYEVGVKVKASGTKYYKAGTKTVTFVVKVK